MTLSSLPDYDFPNSEKPSAACPLVLGGKALAVESAELSLRLITETWDGEKSVYLADPSVRMVLELFVDESSGEDGAPAPLLNVTFSEPLPAPDVFFRSELSDGEVQCEASYGNEAPTLEQNRLTMLGLHDGEIGIRWTARYGEDGRRLPFLFEGKVMFKGLMGTVKKPADFHATLAKVAPAWAGLRCRTEEKVDFDLPSADGARWVNCTVAL